MCTLCICTKRVYIQQCRLRPFVGTKLPSMFMCIYKMSFLIVNPRTLFCLFCSSSIAQTTLNCNIYSVNNDIKFNFPIYSSISLYTTSTSAQQFFNIFCPTLHRNPGSWTGCGRRARSARRAWETWPARPCPAGGTCCRGPGRPRAEPSSAWQSLGASLPSPRPHTSGSLLTSRPAIQCPSRTPCSPVGRAGRPPRSRPGRRTGALCSGRSPASFPPASRRWCRAAWPSGTSEAPTWEVGF